MSTTIGSDVREYLQAVRSHLDDLSLEERDDLLEDLEQHLIEVSAEGEGSLADKIGSPAAFAAELRASAGLTVSDRERLPLRSRAKARLAGSWLGRSLQTAPVRAVHAFWPELRPGWWVLRGYAAVHLLSRFAFADGDLNVIPNTTGNGLVDIALVALAVWGSVLLGKRGTATGLRAVSIVANVAGVLGMITVISSDATIRYADHYDDGSPGYLGYLHHADAQAIVNICPYTATGQALTNVLLFDQDGRQITNAYPANDDARVAFEDDPGIELTPPPEPSLGSDPSPQPKTSQLPNTYPRAYRVFEENGTPRQFTCPAIAEPPAASSPKPSARPTPRSTR